MFCVSSVSKAEGEDWYAQIKFQKTHEKDSWTDLLYCIRRKHILREWSNVTKENMYFYIIYFKKINKLVCNDHLFSGK